MRDAGYFHQDSGTLAELEALTARRLEGAQVPLAASLQKNVPIYDMGALRTHLGDTSARRDLMAEWAWVLGQGPGVLVLKSAYADTAPIDRATAVYEAIIAREKAAGGGGADHFAAAGANDRIWNSLQKLCLDDPECFALYFGNPVIDAVCEAWLGPFHQMTAQVNLVRPGGKAQSAHRDFHLGFQTAEVAARFPAHVHALSAIMTLQGAIAHCDMPLESGPTQLLPFSQLVPGGYMAYRRAEVAAYFREHAVQLPLQKGDALFFNPALYHAAGDNVSSDINRMANLVQVSSAFGRAMEAVDRMAMCRALYPALLRLKAGGQLDVAGIDAAIGAAAEGYAFPTNLDTDPPVGGLAPETQAAVMARALDAGWTPEAFEAALQAHAAKRVA
ncbi:phytanoyl-CoA dioxygenase family protein [Roseicyclus mahoneyensis]|uniref:Ectoine hydroxylase-related dioxygenase (Phytanoyl-CoA dioxygenase family) n=1 Tax=Roseicyclus mahoneyensis TaxID=164332 RepID=A0A316GME3_9RHOB|nr:phytanoyl-CoA dioxygenase family protein [Roseicyclus mahoneyensis]PWK62340.1 ectoine hydroxylase-related dioxygenase (phytanoyl-CoA dioxygenase family) [Roseicyclus mahoneyensis]